MAMAPRDKTSRDAAKQSRSAARLYAVQALFQMEASGTDLTAVQEEFETHRMGAELDGDALAEGDLDLFRALVSGAVSGQAQIDQTANTALDAAWPIRRIDPTLRALFRAAGAEFLADQTPVKVTINEFVDVAKAFFPGGKEVGFVNGVLDGMARALKPEAFSQSP